MKKFATIISAILLMSSTASAQLGLGGGYATPNEGGLEDKGFYSYIMEDSLPDNLFCYISVSKKKYSVLLYDQIKGSDILPCMIVSQGKIYKKGNQVIMKDNVYGYKMYASLNEEGLLTINRGYGFLSGKHFLFQIDEEEEWVPDRDFSRRSYHASLRKYKRNHKKTIRFTTWKIFIRILLGKPGYTYVRRRRGLFAATMEHGGVQREIS